MRVYTEAPGFRPGPRKISARPYAIAVVVVGGRGLALGSARRAEPVTVGDLAQLGAGAQVEMERTG